MIPEYVENLKKAMTLLSDNGYIFTGQAVACAGTFMSGTLEHIPLEQRIELPVAENMQMGMATGIVMAGGKVCTIFPRINFMLDAISQLVQHLDKIPLFSCYKPKVIIRTAIATPIPLDAGVQHLGNYTEAVRAMLSTINVVELTSADMIIPAYQAALDSELSTILVEVY